jgi:hypothetical protein
VLGGDSIDAQELESVDAGFLAPQQKVRVLESEVPQVEAERLLRVAHGLDCAYVTCAQILGEADEFFDELIAEVNPGRVVNATDQRLGTVYLVDEEFVEVFVEVRAYDGVQGAKTPGQGAAERVYRVAGFSTGRRQTCPI